MYARGFCLAMAFFMLGAAAGPPAAARGVRGLVRAIHEVAFSIDINARAARIGFREGQIFRQGDLLVEFDCRQHFAELKALEATAREMMLTLESDEHLLRHKAAGRNEVAISKARAEKADAEAEALRVRLGQCKIEAPFDGTIAKLELNQYEHASPQKPFMFIVSAAQSEVEIIVPSSLLRRLQSGKTFNFTIDETGETLPLMIDRISGHVDAVSQTTKLYAKWVNGPAAVLPGMSGTAEFDDMGQSADGAR